ncbi:precorrin-2 methylase [Gynuella sunshinyii YC6258]|uniref:Precorrin-2 methylase n=2 Tax=Gynuella sunshinyii TaxID=1445505 RepID=A0A0C5VD50_9GAMM|nr:precorrin-2 C(20)-methyltransferase [Gynuella sunshinyii]AJQ92171.1 precorrin-2 methylase [Gynuella sunshinyii YC6258]
MSPENACFYGVGVGPGDPELLTLKALRHIQQADVIAYIANPEGHSQARQIVAEFLRPLAGTVTELPVVLAMSDERSAINREYDAAAAAICRHLREGRSVAFLCEGDPLFFASFSYLLDRIKPRFSCVVIPGISSPQAASARLQLPLTMLAESYAVISGRHDDAQILLTLKQFDSVVIMKAGRSRQRLLALLQQSGRSDDARYLEYIGRTDERVVEDVRTLADESGPYFSLFVVTRQERQSR